MTLDSLGVTWLMIETNTGLRLVGDRGHLHRHVEVFERDVAVAFAERAFRLEQLRIDQAFDDDLGVGRHVEIDGDAFHRADRLAGERAGDAHLVHVDGELLRAGEGHDRRAADDDGARASASSACGA